jgi:hypothetical protein
MKKNYRRSWMTTEVLECIKLKKEAFDKWLSSKQHINYTAKGVHLSRVQMSA